jgi:hypothetical protein
VVPYQTGEVAIGTTILPIDDSIPQNDEGNEYMTLAIIPKNANNYLKIDVVVQVAHSINSAKWLTAALFQDTASNALATMSDCTTVAHQGTNIKFTHYMVAGTIISTTFKVRIGCDQVGTTTFNGFNSNRVLGGKMASSIIITEIAA